MILVVVAAAAVEIVVAVVGGGCDVAVRAVPSTLPLLRTTSPGALKTFAFSSRR